ncbi:hypothetical protein [Bradyrhizobium viridifuturi]|uniref:hypothetical protein n=1 Tax=Bradyrhizobium viridifuturi TaxID=1654716 RepID=UPI001FCD064D|nr:hypothetical protein [Bradyrhizobium viridifuturi]
MKIAMDGQELTLFKSFVDLSQRYLEFGSGGSTWLACQTRKEWVISIDSSLEWLNNVGDATRDASTRPLLLHVDIGKLREWGYPVEKEKEGSWPEYHERVWERPESKTPISISSTAGFAWQASCSACCTALLEPSSRSTTSRTAPTTIQCGPSRGKSRAPTTCRSSRDQPGSTSMPHRPCLRNTGWSRCSRPAPPEASAVYRRCGQQSRKLRDCSIGRAAWPALPR